jgi:hypothetical protein
VTVAGKYAYIAGADTGLRILDISNPAIPIEVGYLDTPSDARVVRLVGHYAYVADGDNGLRIIDVSNKAAPIEIGFYDTPGNAEGVDVEGRFAYVADNNGGLRVIDIFDPSAPLEVGNFGISEAYIMDIDVVRDFAYIIAIQSSIARLIVLDIIDPSSPSEAGSYYFSGESYDLMVSGSFAYVSVPDGVHIIDISTPTDPIESGVCKTAGESVNAWALGNYIYIADGDGGLAICQLLTDRVTGLIPTTGGSLVSTSGDTTLIFGSGAFADTVEVTYKHLLYDENTGYRAGIGETFDIAAIYADTQENANLVPGGFFTLTEVYADSQVGPAVEDTLALFSWNGFDWVREPTSTLDPVNNIILATPSHLSRWAVLGETNRVWLSIIRR